ncbi:hypothetical protein K440DRAFT_664525 [Wilcoxina mikolae CBS 423.85]|nr:hypothetical protein K440DRAFT_664525 [Wilcoxina mikolae CBS 423.85]
MSSSSDSYQPYVEDYDSVISEVVPLTRRTTTNRKSGLSNETSMSSSYDGVSDSGYSSTNTPNNETPPLPSTTPAPPTPAPTSTARQDAFKRASTPGIPRPSSKAFNRSSSAVPRNIPNAKPRERSPTMPSTGGADECDCADCKKDTAKASPSSPSVLSSAAWPLHSSYQGSGSYTHSPSWPNYPYPTNGYDGYGTATDSGATDTSSRSSDKKRTSMPPPPRPLSTFSGGSGSSYSAGYGSYFGHAPSPAPAPPTPSSTCPPTAFSAYAPPPLNTNIAPSPGPSSAYSPYGPPSSVPTYSSSYSNHDSWGRNTTPISPSSSYPDYSSMPPPPPIITGSSSSSSSSNRRNSMRAQANAGAAYHELDEYTSYPLQQPPSRRSSRVMSGERPSSSWAQATYLEGLDRSVSVPPGGTVAHESSRRKTTTPGPAPNRRRESGHSQSSSGHYSSRLGPSALSRAMESCAITDDPPMRSSHSRSHSDYYPNHVPSHGQLARRDHGTLMQPANSDSGSSRSSGSHHDSREELVQMTVPDSDGETFTMRYPAGIPVKLQLNGGAHKTIAFGPKEKNENIECSIAYRYVQQRQQQVHAQLQYGALEHGSRKTSASDYTYRPTTYGRRATMSGAGM